MGSRPSETRSNSDRSIVGARAVRMRRGGPLWSPVPVHHRSTFLLFERYWPLWPPAVHFFCAQFTRSSPPCRSFHLVQKHHVRLPTRGRPQGPIRYTEQRGSEYRRGEGILS